MVEVFRTNVEEKLVSKNIIDILLLCFPENEINFDLDDCDKILRIEGNIVNPELIIQLVANYGYECNVLD